MTMAHLRITSAVLLAAAGACALSPAAAAPSAPHSLQREFAHPPASSRPWCYWYWISDNISREGITRDLEAMARAGIGEALIGNIFLEDVAPGGVKVLTEQWWRLVEHAIREGARVGVHIGIFNCPGWSQSGGPWIQPKQAMRYLVSSEKRVTGPARFEGRLTAPKTPFEDVALLAFPVPKNDADSLALHAPHVTCSPAVPGAEKLVDGDRDAALALAAGAGKGGGACTISMVLSRPLAARSLELVPGDSPWAAHCELQAEGKDRKFHTLRAFEFDRSNMRVNVGPMPRGAVTVSFETTTSRRFRLVLSGIRGKPALAEIDLSAAARLESFVEKQLGKMFPSPQPKWDTYLWPPRPEPASPDLAVSPGAVRDLGVLLAPDGGLRWDVPPGEWILLRIGMTPTGTHNAPASPEGEGLEVDKMNRAAARVHFDAFIGRLLERMPASDRTALRHVVADSYEMGPENWTNGFARTFQSRYGYDPRPWLPVLTGRVVGGADRSDRFLWDLRRLVADRIAADYVGGLRDLCRSHGLELWLENYGHWGFPAEFLQYGGRSDRVGGEFWVTGSLGSVECRAASSAANTYGKPIVSAEAFTGGPPFQTVPRTLKARGDWAFCEGINHFVLHVCIHQPWEDRKPGVNAWFGTEFNRHNTWFEAGRAWIDYIRRCSFLLQQGTRVADVAYFIGEDAPKMTGIRRPELPPGRDFDYINAEVIESKLRVRDGILTLPHGTTYRVLVLPPSQTMRPRLLRAIHDLVRSGATVLGRPPSRSPSLEDYPRCDVEVRKLAAEIWGPAGDSDAGEHRSGKGRVVWGKSLDTVLEAAGVGPDFTSGARLRYTHRIAGDMDVYFVANPKPRAVATTAAFRAGEKAPELWRPDTGRIEPVAAYGAGGGRTRVPLRLGPHGSVFVVFRGKPAAAERVVSVTRNGKVLLDTSPGAAQALEGRAEGGADVSGTFTLAVWAKPAADTTLPTETNQGVHGLAEPRNDALFPPHGDSFGGHAHAGSGLAVGRNGVCVFEHGADYFAPVLVCPTPLTGWTHVAVVYRDGRPTLYLNGRLARRGLKSTHIVHPGAAENGGGGATFQGELGSFERFARALTESEVAQLAQSMPRPQRPLAQESLDLARVAGGAVKARIWQPGRYVLEYSGGATRQIEAASVCEPVEIDGPWEVRFTPGWGAPPKATFKRLEDWTRRPEDGIRHYGGKATYRIAFDLPDSMAGKPLRLDLGKVRDLATVRVNGHDLGTLWIAPWRVDITAAAHAGSNVLEVDVVNSWNNRLAGDAALPPARRRTFLAAKTFPANAPLLEAGLLGPVTVRAAEAPTATATRHAPPYPPSRAFHGIRWAPASTIVRKAGGSDNWPITWADDGDLYAAYGDGRGFAPKVEEKLSLGLARISGGPDDFRGLNIRSPSAERTGDGASGQKASGMLMVDGVLYLWVRNAGNSRLGWSADHGKKWTWASWKFTTSFGCPTFLNFGKNYAGARDRYVYLYSPDADSAYKPADRMVLARVPRGRIAEREAYEFFQKRDRGGRALWTPDIARRGAVFRHPGRCYRGGISYHPVCKRYLWCQVMPQSTSPRGPRFQGGFGIYDAPEPWGPWTTVYFTERWDVGPGETCCIPTKWISADGKTLYLVFSGDDHFSVRKGTLLRRRSRQRGTDRQD